MATDIEAIHRDIAEMKRSLDFIKHILAEDYELSDETKKSLAFCKELFGRGGRFLGIGGITLHHSVHFLQSTVDLAYADGLLFGGGGNLQPLAGKIRTRAAALVYSLPRRADFV